MSVCNGLSCVLSTRVCMYVCMCVCMHGSVCVYLQMCVHARVCRHTARNFDWGLFLTNRGTFTVILSNIVNLVSLWNFIISGFFQKKWIFNSCFYTYHTSLAMGLVCVSVHAYIHTCAELK